MERTKASRIFVALLLTVGCAASPATKEEKEEAEPAAWLENTEWRLVDISGRAATAPPGRTPTLQLLAEGRKAVGNGGCNRFGGSYTLEGSGLRFGPLASTKMFCDSVMEQEQAFLDALMATTGYRIEGNELLLLSPNGPLARLRPGSE